MTTEQIRNLAKQYAITLATDEDIENAFDFVRDVLQAEADITNEQEPYATNTIKALEGGARQIMYITCDFICES